MKVPMRTRADLRQRFVKSPLPEFASAEQGRKADSALQPADASLFATALQGAQGAAAYAWGDHAAAVAAAQASADAALARTPLWLGVAVFEEQVAAGTGGGASLAAAWNQRRLNTEIYNTIAGLTLTAAPSYLLTVPAGTYWVTVDGPAWRVGSHKIGLSNDAGTSVFVHGTPEYSGATAALTNRSQLSSVVAVAAPASWTLWHYTELANADAKALGYPCNLGATVERYGRITIVRLI